MRFTDAIIDSFALLRKEPKFFLPKIFIAFLYSISMYLTANILVSFVDIIQTSTVYEAVLYAQSMLGTMWLLLIFSLFALILDALVNAMYPKLVEDFYSKKKISFIVALKSALGRAGVVLPSVFIALGISTAASIPFIFYLSFSIIAGDSFGMALSLLLILVAEFATTAVFYLVYPVSMLEKHNVQKTLRKSFSLCRADFSGISKASALQIILSIASFALAAASSNPAFLALFVVSRVLTALIATYIIVLNQVVYIEMEKGARNAS